MRRVLLVCGLGVLWGFMDPAVVVAHSTDFQLSQTTSDMVPLLDSLRESNEPELPLAKGGQVNEQVMRELTYLNNIALSSPEDDMQRQAAGQAAWLLGLLHLHGAGVSVSSRKAKQWFTLAWHYGESMASAGLAWCAYDGCQSAPDRSRPSTQRGVSERRQSRRPAAAQGPQIGRRHARQHLQRHAHRGRASLGELHASV